MIPRLLLVSALALPACASTYPTSTATVSSASLRSVAVRLDEAAGAVDSLGENIPAAVLLAARCVVVVPRLVSGGLIFGAEKGRGFTSCRTPHGWSALLPVTVTGGTFGAQIGVESRDVLMLVMTEEARGKILDSKLELGGDVSAAAGPVGTGKGSAWDGRTSVLTYSRASGLYAGADLTGAAVHADLDGLMALYGPEAGVSSVLDGAVPATPPTARLLDAIGRAFR